MRYLVCLYSLLNFFHGAGQVKPSDADTTSHSVKKAIVFSAVVPGAGQIYNHIAMPKGKKKAFWKVPLIYAGLGATNYFLIKNQSLQRELKTEYKNRETGNNTDPDWEAYDDQGILTLYNQYLDRRDLSILAVGGVYLFQLLDAGIEAHFVRFDISKDLSMQIRPTIIGMQYTGVRASFNFR